MCPAFKCWICGLPVRLESCATDEQGKAVHEKCYFVRTTLEFLTRSKSAAIPEKPRLSVLYPINDRAASVEVQRSGAKEAVLTQIEYSNSGVCSVCGDLLMTGGQRAATAEESLKRLEQIFEQHLAEKHREERFPARHKTA